MSLQVITVPPKTGTPKGLMVVLHGWGANAQDLAAVVPLLNLPDYQFMVPDAPFTHPYLATGRAWYSLDQDRGQGLPESRKLLTEWLQSLESSTGVPLSRTILSGFSQGAAMTLDVGLHLPLAGLVALSGYLHPITTTNAQYPPVLLVHGTLDSVVPLQAALSAKQTLSALGVTVQDHKFEMGHEIRPEVLGLIRNFVLEVMPKENRIY